MSHRSPRHCLLAVVVMGALPLAACGSAERGGDDAGAGDATTAGDGSTGQDAGVLEDAATGSAPVDGCVAFLTPPGPGHHNPGEDCMPCHTGGWAAKWTAAGTIYDGVDSTTTIAGASVIITDSVGTMVHLVTAENGNFGTMKPFVFPIDVRVSCCPDSAHKTTPVSNGSCNSCHVAGSRIALPEP